MATRISESVASPADNSNATYAQLNLIGESPAFLDCLRLIRRMAACDATVLIQGETGTGKELAARAIHYLGPRRSAPFIPVNCGALPESLVESELFGHVRGAFTDARETCAGVIAQAEGGTLFLDEVEALGLHAQVALLRFLQEREYRPIGGQLVRGAKVRVVASANVDLTVIAENGTFRQDLLFRLNVLPLTLPPLRDRGEDVATLAETFLRRFSRQYGQPQKTLDADSASFLSRHTWPGNVRELENLIHRQVLLSDSTVIRLVPERTEGDGAESTFREAKARAIAEFERRYVVTLLLRTRGNISLAARLSGKERSRLCKMVKKYGLERARFAVGEPIAKAV
jgi:DNA-binding NtrC family response regulator